MAGDVLDLALRTENEYRRAKALVTLAPQMSWAQALVAFDAARSVGGSLLRAELLSALAPVVPDEHRCEVLELALGAVTIIDEEEHTSEFGSDWDANRKDVLVSLAAQLSGRQRGRGLDAVESLRVPWHRAEALLAFLPTADQPDELMDRIRSTMLTTLSSVEHWSLHSFFVFYPVRELFRPPILTPDAIYAIASHIREICNDWRW